MSRFVILLAGPIAPTEALRRAVARCRVLAADRGMTHAEPLGLEPELWVGDFDSASAELAARHPAVPRAAFPRDKDMTDGEIAIEEALRRGATDLLLVGALGGPRTDHAFAHLVLALRYAEAGHRVALFDGREHAVPLRPGETRLATVPGAAFSILKFGDLEGLSIAGARWPLNDVALPFTSILTQSNEATGAEVTVTLRQGRAILIAQASAEKD
ncbi:thiamine pyrophosphokinase [Aureimonas endophytica]|uniref:Thiamine diphosphokinase n=1 Tax=Aureimonas endophytica TaxID=2027858 RepID=A0A917EDA1_9HYPH|nr:thiamine diphosphokinase [Aureimonas endophytica]GGE21144.1 thiamine pyrophosphokinase [Aureimonas endophytica]